MTTFKIGERVTLNSGSPVLTVEGIAGNEVTCAWFEGSTLRRGVFKAEMLTAYVPGPTHRTAVVRRTT